MPGFSRIAILGALAGAALPGNAHALECTCRAGGRDYELGRTICMQTPSGRRLATCAMSLNNTSWRLSPTPCAESRAAPSNDFAIRPPPSTRQGGG